MNYSSISYHLHRLFLPVSAPNALTTFCFRFEGILPNGTVNLDTRLNTELVKEVITVLHASPDKKLDLLIGMLMAESEELDDLKARRKGSNSLGPSFHVRHMWP